MKKFEFERVGRILSEVKNLIVKKSKPVDNLVLIEEDLKRTLTSNLWFGEKDQNYIVSGELVIPESFKEETLMLTVYSSLTETDNSTNPQIKFFLNDCLIQGFDVNHKEVFLHTDDLLDTNTLRFEIYSGREEKKFPLTVLLQVIDEATYEFYYDLYVLYDSWRSISQEESAYFYYERELGKAVNYLSLLEAYTPEYYCGLQKASQLLQNCFYKLPVDSLQPTCYAVGHTHIDLAWLWTVMQAVQKGERSYSTVLRMMEDFPDYTFIQSQPQMYELIKETYPNLFQRIKEKILSGQWEAEGAMWVEADCNLTSGESLVRQFLYGKRFLKKEFNHDSQILWLPDVFGYSAALPQIMKKTNTPYFMTTKLSWNQYNKIPYDSFYWQGIDGSRILTHMMPTVSEGYSPTPHYTTYNGMLDPYTVKKSWQRYQEKNVSDHYLIAYGYGDGGGGPTREMLETLMRMKNGLPAMPTVKASTANEFFDVLEQDMQNYPEKEWLGELYFEYHRGTYTSIGKIKQQNRQNEILLKSLEKLFSAALPDEYPKALFEKWWKKVLLNQFHDILPGSAIEAVYNQTDQDYQEIALEKDQLLMKYLLLNQASKKLYIFNPNGFSGNFFVKLDLPKEVILLDGNRELVSQRTNDGSLLVEIPQMEALSGKYLTIGHSVSLSNQKTSVSLPQKWETPDFLIEFDDNYQMVSVFDKVNQRELTEYGGIVNQLTAYEDLPLHYDAWDIDRFYQEKPIVINDVQEAVVLETGQIRDTLLIKRKFHHSSIIQKIHILHGKQEILFETELDWHQHHCLLKAGFPVPVNATEATYDIQFGSVKRAVHHNTSWDEARFEVAGQKWVDLSDDGYGISLLTDSKYGYDAGYGHLGVSLVRGATDPYPDADQGFHKFSYGIYCHSGNWKTAETQRRADQMNTPLLSFQTEKADLPTGAWVSCDAKNIVIDVLKQAEDDEATIIRSYEQFNRRSVVNFVFQNPIKRVSVCNLLEEEIDLAKQIDSYTVQITFNPFEIVTLKAVF